MELKDANTMHLYSQDYAVFSVPNAVTGYATTMIGERHCLKATIQDAIIGQQYGYGGEDIDVVYLLGRFDDMEVIELKKFPIHVHVLILKKGAVDKNDLKNFTNIGWAVLYDDISNIPLMK